jgi:hypothetical protein
MKTKEVVVIKGEMELKGGFVTLALKLGMKKGEIEFHQD